MMRYFFSVSLMISAMGLPVAAGTISDGGTGSGKGTRSTPVASVAASAKAPAAAATPSVMIPVKQPKASQPFIVITPRLPEAGDRPTLVASRNPGMAAAGFSGAYGERVSAAKGRLARVTAYWPSEGDYYTRHGVASTGVRLHDGHCAVDPNIIPYGSVVSISGIGTFLAVDTGSAVVDRVAAREGGHNKAERGAIVVDLFFESRREGEAFASSAAKWASITWWTPGSNASGARQARSLFADEDWQKIQNKQL